jgi:hypothetical protein
MSGCSKRMPPDKSLGRQLPPRHLYSSLTPTPPLRSPSSSSPQERDEHTIQCFDAQFGGTDGDGIAEFRQAAEL